MKRLLCILSSLDVGGAETFMMKILRNLPCDYAIDFVVSTQCGFYEKEVLEKGSRIYRVPLRTKEPFKAYRTIKRIAINNNYCAVLKLCDTPIGYFDLLASKHGGIGRICIRSCNASSNEGVVRKVINTVLRPAFNSIADVKIAPSILAANYTFGKRAVNRNKVHILHNALDYLQYEFCEENRQTIRNELQLDDSNLVIGHIGRFNFQKNHEFLLKVFKEIHQMNSKAKLILVGDGEEKKKIIEISQKYGLTDSVIFTGVRSDANKLYSAFDVFVLPSLFEGMPNTAIEAQANGLNVVLADTITPEVNITGLVHFLSLQDDIDKWAKTIINCISKPRTDTKTIFFKRKYDINSIVNEFIDLIFEE